ncbi:MAG: hypothetical protein ACE5HT_10155 [Gemmatimonadales bacterium]
MHSNSTDLGRSNRGVLVDRADGTVADLSWAEIQSIARRNGSSAVVTLVSGEEHILRGTNDVDDDNRGIAVADPGMGQVTVQCDQFDEVRFHAPENKAPAELDGGHLIRGTVFTSDGETYSGDIRWDNDEEYTWEILDAEQPGIEFDIEFGLIETIEKISSSQVNVTLKDGRSFRVGDSNDVDEDNLGIFIRDASGGWSLVDWSDFDRVEFSSGQ